MSQEFWSNGLNWHAEPRGWMETPMTWQHVLGGVIGVILIVIILKLTNRR